MRGEMKNAFTVLDGKMEVKRRFKGCRRKCEGSVRMDQMEMWL
jgi:hypothetical protein